MSVLRQVPAVSVSKGDTVTVVRRTEPPVNAGRNTRTFASGASHTSVTFTVAEDAAVRAGEVSLVGLDAAGQAVAVKVEPSFFVVLKTTWLETELQTELDKALADIEDMRSTVLRAEEIVAEYEADEQAVIAPPDRALSRIRGVAS